MTTTEARLKRSTLARNLSLALASTVAALLAAEAGFRVLGHLENRGVLDRETPLEIEPPADGPAELGHMIRLSENDRIIYELKPGLDVVYRGARVSTDSQGFRSRSSSAELETAGYRIVGIGDSFMFGQGVELGETYLGVLERRLRKARPEIDARVLNMAVPGYNTVMEVATLKEKALGYRPDLVIIEFVDNDLRLPNFIRTRNDVLALDRSYLVDFVEHRGRRRRELSLEDRLRRLGLEPGLGVDDRRVPPEYRDMLGLSAYIDAMRELRALSLEHGFQVLTTSLVPPGFQSQVIAVSSDLGFHVLDVRETFDRYLEARGFAEYLGSPLAQGPDDGHPSVAGHRVAAGAIYRYLEDFVLRATASS